MTEMRDGYEKQAQVFRALAHPVRLRILDILSKQEACVCHLTAILGQRQPYVSQQLATLRESALARAARNDSFTSVANTPFVESCAFALQRMSVN